MTQPEPLPVLAAGAVTDCLSALQLRLVYASNSMEDILMKLHLDAMAAGFYGKFKVRPHCFRVKRRAAHHV